MCVIVKNKVLLWFTINSQSKLKQFSILFLTYLPRKTRYEIYQGFMVGFLNWRSQKVSQELFRQKLLFGLEFFSSTVECCPQKQNKKYSWKRCKSPKNCWQLTQIKTLKKEKKNEKWEKVIQQLFTFTFLYRKTYISLESIFGKYAFI